MCNDSKRSPSNLPVIPFDFDVGGGAHILGISRLDILVVKDALESPQDLILFGIFLQTVHLLIISEHIIIAVIIGLAPKLDELRVVLEVAIMVLDTFNNFSSHSSSIFLLIQKNVCPTRSLGLIIGMAGVGVEDLSNGFAHLPKLSSSEEVPLHPAPHDLARKKVSKS